MNHQPKKQDRTVEWCVGAGVGIFVACLLYCFVKVGIDQIQYADAVTSPEPERVPEEIRVQLPKPPSGAKVKVTTYGEAYRGKPMALNGEPFNPDKMTCAHRVLGIPGGPLVYVRFTNAAGKSIEIPCTDRGPWDRYPIGHPRAGEYRKDFDLSTAAFRALSPNMTGGEGLRVTAEVVAR